MSNKRRWTTKEKGGPAGEDGLEKARIELSLAGDAHGYRTRLVWVVWSPRRCRCDGVGTNINIYSEAHEHRPFGRMNLK